MTGRGAPRVVLLAAAALAACAEIDSSPDEWSYDGPVNSCKGGCAEGACDPEVGGCAVDPPAGAQLVARVVPAAATGVPPQLFPIDVGSGSAGTLYVAAPVPVVGAALAGEGADVEPLVGRIVFADVGNRLPGRPARVAVYDAEGGGELDLALVPGTYDAVVIPEGSQATQFPAHYVDGIAVGPDGVLRDAGGAAVDIVAPPAAAWVTGRITQASAPVNGLEVFAFDPATGRTISTVDLTACDEVAVEGPGVETVCGHFAIALAQGAAGAAAQFSLRVARPGEANHPVFRADGFDPPAAGGSLDLTDDERLAFGPLGVPARFRAVVRRPVRNAAGEVEYDPAASCFVSLGSADVGGGAVEKWVLTNESGEIEDSPGVVGVNLYPGAYDLTVVPAHASLGAADDYEGFTSASPWYVSAETEDDEATILLASRPMLLATVSAGGRSVPASAVSAEPGEGAPFTARPNSGITGKSGRLRLRLDRASYVVTAEAPQESRYAWRLAEADVAGDVQGEIGVDLPLPYVLRGEVATSPEQIEAIDLGGAVVEWYREYGGRAYAVGRSMVAEDGGFAALLPP